MSFQAYDRLSQKPIAPSQFSIQTSVKPLLHDSQADRRFEPEIEGRGIIIPEVQTSLQS